MCPTRIKRHGVNGRQWVSASRFSTAPEPAARARSPLAAGIARFSPGSYPAGSHRLLAGSSGVDRRRSNAVAEHPHASLSVWPWLVGMLSWAGDRVDDLPETRDRHSLRGGCRRRVFGNRDRSRNRRVWRSGPEDRGHTAEAVRWLYRPRVSRRGRRLGVRVERLSWQGKDPDSHSHAASGNAQPLCLCRDSDSKRPAHSHPERLAVLYDARNRQVLRRVGSWRRAATRRRNHD